MVRRELRRATLSVVAFAVVSLAAATLPTTCGAWSQPEPPTALVKGRGINNSGDLPGWCGIKLLGPDGTYYSGTAAYVIGRWIAGTGDSIKKVELWVNGVRRYQKEWTSNYPSVYPDAISCDLAWKWVLFSTTQFSHGSTLTLKAKVWTTDDQYAQATDTQHKAWNRAYVLQNRNLDYAETICTHVNNRTSSMNHAAPGPYDTDHAEDIVGPEADPGGRVKAFSVFYADTHGRLGELGDCYCTKDPPEECIVKPPDVAGAVAAKDGDYPGYNFVFLDSCNSAEAPPSFCGAFQTTASLGWVGLPEDSQPYADWAKAFFDGLVQQKSVVDARSYADDEVGGIAHQVGWGDQTYKVHLTY